MILKSLSLIGICALTVAISISSHATTPVIPPSPFCLLDLSLGEIETSPQWLREANKEAVQTIMANSAPLREAGNPEAGFHKGQIMASGPLPAGSEKLTYKNAVYLEEDWQRDGGITTNALVEVLLDDEFLRDDVFGNPDHTLKDRKKIVLQTLMDNLAYQKTIQSLDSKQLGGAGVYDEPVNGQIVRRYHPAFGLAKRRKDLSEPPWMNPQIDGPGYEQKSNLRLANYIWDKWNKLFGKYSSVRTDLSRNDIYQKSNNGDIDGNNSIIKNLFEYIYHNWRGGAFEMWEEVKSKEVAPDGNPAVSGGHFATIGALQAVMLIEGPEFTAKIGDAEAGREYQKEGIFKIEPFLKNNFWDNKYKVIRASLDPVEVSLPDNAGHPKFIANDPRVFNGVSAASPIDSQFLIGLCHMKSPTFTLASDMAMSSIYNAEMLFKGYYPINHGKNVVLWGRSINDIYSGMFEKEDKIVDGELVKVPILKSQPWLLITAYVAEGATKTAEELASYGQLRHLFAHALKSRNEIKIDGELAKVLFKMALKDSPQQGIDTFAQLNKEWSSSGFTINSADPNFKYLLKIVGQHHFVVNDLNVKFLNYVFEQVGYSDRVQVGQRIASDSPIIKRIITAQIIRGDLIAKEVLKYKDADGGLSEQINPDANDDSPYSKEAGAQRQRSAPKLTWSSSVIIRFAKARKRAIARASQLDPTLFTNTAITD